MKNLRGMANLAGPRGMLRLTHPTFFNLFFVHPL